MFRYITIILLTAFALAAAPATGLVKTDEKTFDLNPVAAAVPVLQYRLTVLPTRRLPGNAALSYFRALVCLPEGMDAVDKALDDHAAGKSLAGDTALAAYLEKAAPVVALLDQASRQTDCDWGQLADGDQVSQILPVMNSRAMANLLHARCARQLDQDDIPGAVESIRMELALATRIQRGSFLVGGLVAVATEAAGLDMIADLMNRPDAPNLYAPLATLRRPLIDFADVYRDERQWTDQRLKQFLKAPAVDLKSDQFKPDETVVVITGSLTVGGPLQDQTNRIVQDEVELVLSLPLPESIAEMKKLPERIKTLKVDPTNLMVLTIPALSRTVETSARVQRTEAALLAVEAIRSYAASHGGALPKSLAEVPDAPMNPVTGKAFDYKLAGDTATLSDETSPVAISRAKLIYTIHIRKK